MACLERGDPGNPKTRQGMGIFDNLKDFPGIREFRPEKSLEIIKGNLKTEKTRRNSAECFGRTGFPGFPGQEEDRIMKIKMDLSDKCQLKSIPVGEICLLADLSPIMRVEIPYLEDAPKGEIWILTISDGKVSTAAESAAVRPMGKSRIEVKGSSAGEIAEIIAAEKAAAEKAAAEIPAVKA
jgi:hypothetical protein